MYTNILTYLEELENVDVGARLLNQELFPRLFPLIRDQNPHLPISFIGILLPKNQRQHRTLHIQKDVLPYASC